MDRLVLPVLLLVGPGLLLAAPIFVFRRRRFLRGAYSVIGVVEECESEKLRDGPPTFRLTVRYRLPDGREHRFSQGGCGLFEPGSQITVLYDPARPEGARVAFDERSVWLNAGLMLLIGLVGTGFLIAFWSRIV